MSAPFKVGLIAILTTITVLFGMFYIWKINPYSNYTLYAHFPHVGNLTLGSHVTLMGVRIGEVVAIVPEPSERRVRVAVQIQRGIQLPVGSHFAIVTTGLVGTQNIEILPPENPGSEFLQADAEVEGQPPASLDQIFSQAQAMLKSARDLVENEEMRENILTTVSTITNTAKQLDGLFKDIKVVTRGFGGLTKQTEILLKQINFATATTIPEVRAIIASTRRIAGNMEMLSGRINQLAHDPHILGDTRTSISNMAILTQKWNSLTDDLQGLTRKIDGIADDVREVTHDPEVKSSIKTVAKNATRLTKAVLDFTNPEQLTQTNQFDINFRAEAMGAARFNSRSTDVSIPLNDNLHFTPGAVGNFNMYGDLGLNGPVSYFRVGLDEIGDGNLINLQLGSQLGTELTRERVVRFGLVRGKIGAGADFGMQLFDQPLTLSGEFYDINSPRMRIGILQNIYQEYGLSAYWDNQFVRGVNEFNLGFRWQPTMAK